MVFEHLFSFFLSNTMERSSLNSKKKNLSSSSPWLFQAVTSVCKQLHTRMKLTPWYLRCLHPPKTQIGGGCSAGCWHASEVGSEEIYGISNVNRDECFSRQKMFTPLLSLQGNFSNKHQMLRGGSIHLWYLSLQENTHLNMKKHVTQSRGVWDRCVLEESGKGSDVVRNQVY